MAAQYLIDLTVNHFASHATPARRESKHIRNMGKTILVTIDESLADSTNLEWVCSAIKNSLLDELGIGPNMVSVTIQEKKKPNKYNSEDFPNHGFVVDSPEHQLLAAAIEYSQSKRRVDEEWGSYCGDRYKERAQGTTSDVAKPLLVLSFSHSLNSIQAHAMSERLTNVLSKVGWQGLVIDGMDKAQVQAFGVHPPTIDTLSLDELIELLEGAKRLRAAPTHGEGGSQH